MVQQSLMVFSDIDGTLIPHPYYSGVKASERALSVYRLTKLLEQNANLFLVTGRKLDGYKRLFTDAGMTPIYPTLLGTEFGAQFHLKGETIYSHPSCVALNTLENLIRQAGREFGEPVSYSTSRAQDDTGMLEGYLIEIKRTVIQLEWNFKNSNENWHFEHALSSVVNPHLSPTQGLYCQFYPKRLDILDSSFFPKQNFFQHLSVPLKDLGMSNFKETKLTIMGDELYDSYMFKYFLEQYKTSFSDINTISVGQNLAHAKHHLKSTEAALKYLEDMFKTSF